MLIVIIQVINLTLPQIVLIQLNHQQLIVQLGRQQKLLQSDHKQNLLHIDQQLRHFDQLLLDPILIRHDHQVPQIQRVAKEEILGSSHLQHAHLNIHQIQDFSSQEIINHYFLFHFHSHLLLHAHVIICIPIIVIFHLNFLMEM